MSDIPYPYTDESPEQRKPNKAAGRALRLIAMERARQDAKWGEQNHHGAVWSLIAGEEFGEVSQAQLEMMFKGSQKDSDPHPREAYIIELVQLAAVCQAWLECELRRDGDS
jgi:3-oxoacyl-(acyl-carrier-protein) synthase